MGLGNSAPSGVPSGPLSRPGPHCSSARVNTCSIFCSPGLQDVASREAIRLRIAGCSNTPGSLAEVVRRSAKLDIRPKHEPISAGFTERHSHTARIHGSNASNRTIKLHMSMAADHDRFVHTCESGQNTIFRGHAGEYIPLRGVAWQNSTLLKPRTATRSALGQPVINRRGSGPS